MIDALSRLPGTARVPDESNVRDCVGIVLSGDANALAEGALGESGLHKAGAESASGVKTFSDGIHTNRISAKDGAGLRMPRNTMAFSKNEEQLSRILRRKDVNEFLALADAMEDKPSTYDGLYGLDETLAAIGSAISGYETRTGRTIGSDYDVLSSAIVGKAVGSASGRQAGTMRSVRKNFFNAFAAYSVEHADTSDDSLVSLSARIAGVARRVSAIERKFGGIPADDGSMGL